MKKESKTSGDKDKSSKNSKILINGIDKVGNKNKLSEVKGTNIQSKTESISGNSGVAKNIIKSNKVSDKNSPKKASKSTLKSDEKSTSSIEKSMDNNSEHEKNEELGKKNKADKKYGIDISEKSKDFGKKIKTKLKPEKSAKKAKDSDDDDDDDLEEENEETPKVVPMEEEPEPNLKDLENIDLELNLKDKPKKNKSRKSGLKKKDEEVQEYKRLPLPDLSGVNYNHFKKSERPEPAKFEAQPSTLVKTEVKKADPIKAEIKNSIFEKCLAIQTNSVSIAKKEMNDAQESANEEKGSMEEKFDSFRESMHITRDMFARQYQEGVNSLTMLKRINPNLESNTVILGSLVYTDFQNYFISVSLGEITLGNDKFITISTSTPLFQALSGKIKGDKFKFRDKVYTIQEVF